MAAMSVAQMDPRWGKKRVAVWVHLLVELSVGMMADTKVHLTAVKLGYKLDSRWVAKKVCMLEYLKGGQMAALTVVMMECSKVKQTAELLACLLVEMMVVW